MNLYPEFEDKNVLVTGVASGIGFAQAKAFLKAGANVYGADFKTNENTQNLTQFAKFHFTKCDVRSHHEIQEWLTPIITTRQIDILLNTAGILDNFAPTLETTEKEWDNIFATNLKSIFLITNIILIII